jgi:hypothetical protein
LLLIGCLASPRVQEIKANRLVPKERGLFYGNLVRATPTRLGGLFGPRVVFCFFFLALVLYWRGNFIARNTALIGG